MVTIGVYRRSIAKLQTHSGASRTHTLIRKIISVYKCTDLVCRGSPIGAKPNLYCEAIELVCGGSPKIFILVKRKSRHRVKPEG